MVRSGIVLGRLLRYEFEQARPLSEPDQDRQLVEQGGLGGMIVKLVSEDERH